MSKSLRDRKVPSWGEANRRGVDKTPIENKQYPFPNSLDLAGDEERLKKARGGELGSNAKVAAQLVPGYSPTRQYSSIVKK